MKQTYYLKSIVVGLAAVLLAFLGYAALKVNAQDSNVVKFSPTRIETTLDPGQTYTDEIVLENISGGDITYAVSVIDFDAQGSETGSPRFLLSEALQSNNPYKLKPYIDVATEVFVKAGENEKVAFTVTLPDDTQPGGHYAGIFFSAKGISDAENVALAATAGPLVLVNVTGEQVIDLRLEGIVAVNESISVGGLSQRSPDAIGIRLSNQGTVHVKPLGALVIKDMFGNEVASLKVNDVDNNILPNSIRRFDSILEEDTKLSFGRYTVDAELFYGENNDQSLTATGTIWVIPVRLILIGLAVILVVVVFGRRSIQAYNRSVVERSKGVKVNKKK